MYLSPVMNRVTVFLHILGFMDELCTCLRGDECGEFPETNCFCVLKYGPPVCIPSTCVVLDGEENSCYIAMCHVFQVHMVYEVFQPVVTSLCPRV